MRVLLIIFFYTITQSLIAQKNTVFLELGGQGGITSLNYERQFNNRTTGLGVRTGIGASVFEFKPNESDSESIAGCAICGVNITAPRISFTMPVTLQYLIDISNSNYMEVGLGSTWQLTSPSIFVHHAVIGFRRQFGYQKRWIWKINFTPIIGVSGENIQKDSEPTIWGGISLGRKF